MHSVLLQVAIAGSEKAEMPKVYILFKYWHHAAMLILIYLNLNIGISIGFKLCVSVYLCL